MSVTGQSWPFKPSTTAQADYWDLDRVNQTINEQEKERLRQEIISGKRRPRRVTLNRTKPIQKVKRLESDLFSKGGIKKLEKDFWGKNKKKKLSQSDKILKRIL